MYACMWNKILAPAAAKLPLPLDVPWLPAGITIVCMAKLLYNSLVCMTFVPYRTMFFHWAEGCCHLQREPIP